MAHRLHQVAGHAREFQQLGRRHLGQRPDDLVHVAARAKVFSFSTNNYRLYRRFILESEKQIPELRIRLERERILLLGTIQRDHADLAPTFSFFAPQEMLRLDHDSASTACCFSLASSLSSSSFSRCDSPASRPTTHPSCARAISPKVRSPARVRWMRNARRSPGSSKRSTSPSFSSWSTMAVILPPVTISRRERAFIFRPSGCRSSCAIRSKRGSVVANSPRSLERTWRSISCVQVSRRSQMRS